MVRRLAYHRPVVPALLAAFAFVLAACGSNGTAGPDTTNARDTPVPTRSSGPSAVIEPRSGPPGTEVTVTGSGWPVGVTVDVTTALANGALAPPFASVTTDAGGDFSTKFRLERAGDGSELQVGRLDLIAHSASTAVSVPFQVQTRRPIGGGSPGG